MSVRPPCVQWTMWWPSHRSGGRSQPGNTQPPSRTVRARRCAGLMSRWLRPRSRISPSTPTTTRRITASHAICCTVAGSMIGPPAMRAPPRPSLRSSARTTIVSDGRTALSPRIRFISASARRWAGVRRGPPSTAFSARSSASYSACNAAASSAPSAGSNMPVEGPHAAERLGQVQTAALVLTVRVVVAGLGVDSQQPLAQQLGSWSTVSFCACSTEQRLVAGERLTGRVAAPGRVGEQHDLRRSEIAAPSRVGGERHVAQPSGRAHEHRCRRPAHLAARCQPGGRRQ